MTSTCALAARMEATSDQNAGRAVPESAIPSEQLATLASPQQYKPATVDGTERRLRRAGLCLQSGVTHRVDRQGSLVLA
jgi:hypothetical protein